jgi:hypothetical protein
MRKPMLLIALLCAFTLQAGNVERTYRKLIERYDVADKAKAVPVDSLSAFWYAAYYGNEQLLRFNMDMQKHRGAEKEAMAKTSELPRFHPQYDESIIGGMQGFCDSLLMDMGISALPVNCSLHVVYSDDVNSFTALTEDGFAMCLTTALISKKGINRDILMGYVAHEFAHGALLHHTRALYAGAKQRRKDNLLSGIAIGVGLAAVTAAAAADPVYYPPYTYGDPVVYLDASDFEALARQEKAEKVSSSKYIFPFSPDQIFEADLLAYRFLEKMGKADQFINGLRILESADVRSYDEENGTPTPTSRIEFLKYVSQNPSLGNKENIKLRDRRLGVEER